MKYPKFKLINSFPNREIGDVALYNPDNCMDNYVWEADGKIIPKEFQPDVTPNWFEMIMEKDYEILSIVGNKSCAWERSCSTEYWDIHSVKRLSDGEIFTIGDKVKYPFSCGSDNILKRIILADNPSKQVVAKLENSVIELKDKIILCVDHDSLGNVTLEDAQKIEVIGTTEDGVDLYEGDSYTFIWTKNPAHGQRINTPYEVHNLEPFDEATSWSKHAKIFSTKEKAQEWLNNNTPLFITEDGKKIFEGDSWWYVVLNKPMMYPRQTNTLVYRGTNTSEVKRFSTEEAANCFILNNREPNFITEDGVKIYPRMKYYAINTKTFNEPREVICEVGTALGKDVKAFSTKELADDYFLMNAPKFSLKDIGKIYSTAGDFKLYKGNYNKYVSRLIRIFNSKID